MAVSLEQLFTDFRSTGDPAPLGELFDRVSPQLLAMALHLCGNPADAEDALQATFVTAIGRAASWDGARPLLPWLFGILLRRCKQIGERRQRRREAVLPAGELLLDDGTPFGASERRELVGSLRQHIERLPTDQRQVLLLQLEHGLSPAEVAEVLGVAPGTVRMRLHRAIKALRGLMPAGLVTSLLGTLHARGLAVVRLAVLQQVRVGVVVVAGGGVMLMKKVLVGALLLVMVATGLWGAGPFRGSAEAAPPDLARVAMGTLAESVAAAPDAAAALSLLRVQPERPTTASSLPAASGGALLVRASREGTGVTVPNLVVRIVPDRSDVDPRFVVTTAATGADGTCRVDGLSPGKVRVEAIGGLCCRAEIHSGETVACELELPAGQAPLATVRGRVLLPDGRAAVAASIVVGPQAGQYAEVIGTADAAGRFELSIVQGFLLVGARLDGYAPSPLRSCTAGDDVELVLPAVGAEVHGLVVDAAGQPVAAAAVVIGEPRGRTQCTDPGGWLEVAAPPQRLCTDGEGRFVARDLPVGELGCLVRADGCAPFHCFVTTVAATSVAVRCELVEGIAVFGRVLDQAGLPVVGVSVSLGGSYGEARATDAQGRFGYRHVTPGPLQLEVLGEGVDRQFCERDATDDSEWVVVVQRLPYYLLHLVDEFGNPLVGWRLQLQPAAVPPGLTDASGRVALCAKADAEPSLWLAPPGAIHAVVPCALPAGLSVGIENRIVVPADRQPDGVLVGSVLGPDGTPLEVGSIEVRGVDGSYLYRQWRVTGPFRFERVPPGDWILEVHRSGRGSAGARYRVAGLGLHEVRDVGELALPGEGTLQVRVLGADGRLAKDAAVYLFDREGEEHHAPSCDGQPHPWPAGRYTFKVMADEGLWQSGSIEVRVGELAAFDVVLQSAVRRHLRFPVPGPDWGEPGPVAFVLRAPDGSVYDRGDFDPGDEMPFRYMPSLSVGEWRVELSLGDGRRFGGAFRVDSLAPSLEPILVAVQLAP